MAAWLRDAATLSAWFEPPYAIVGCVLGIIGAGVLAVAVGTLIVRRP